MGSVHGENVKASWIVPLLFSLFSSQIFAETAIEAIKREADGKANSPFDTTYQIRDLAHLKRELDSKAGWIPLFDDEGIEGFRLDDDGSVQIASFKGYGEVNASLEQVFTYLLDPNAAKKREKNLDVKKVLRGNFPFSFVEYNHYRGAKWLGVAPRDFTVRAWMFVDPTSHAIAILYFPATEADEPRLAEAFWVKGHVNYIVVMVVSDQKNLQKSKVYLNYSVDPKGSLWTVAWNIIQGRLPRRWLTVLREMAASGQPQIPEWMKGLPWNAAR